LLVSKTVSARNTKKPECCSQKFRYIVIQVRVNINGRDHDLNVEPDEQAVEAIRNRAGLLGTKAVCDGGVCGACTVLKDDRPVVSCLLPATSLDGARITTVEGIGKEIGHPVQRAMAREDALQCGYCTPGFVVGAAHFVDTWRKDNPGRAPTREQIARALAGHLCRCGSYAAIYRAVISACVDYGDDTDEPWGGRIGARAKLTGEAVYATDARPKGMLHAVLVRSPRGAGTLTGLNLAPALKLPCVRAAVALQKTGTRIRWVGQPIAAVAGDNLLAARRGAAAVVAEIESRRGVYTVDQATASDAPRVYRFFWEGWRAPRSTPWPAIPAIWRSNRHSQMPLCWFGIFAWIRLFLARRRNDPLLYEATYSTAAQVHSSFEPHATVASWEAGKLTAWVSTQAVDDVTHAIAEKFSIDVADVRVIADYVGGGFGSKLTLSMETVAAVLLAREAARPVCVVPNRREELTTTGARAETRTRVRLLARPDGRLAASSFRSESNGGISVGSNVAALNLLMYSCSPRRSHDTDVVTNVQAATEMRSPCGPPAAWALESAMDELAHRLGQDPLALRQQLDANAKRQALYHWVSNSDLWARRGPDGTSGGRIRHGIGMASSNWFYLVDPGSEVTVSIENGRLVATVAAQDIGQGSATVVARIVGETFGVGEHEVDVRIGRSGPRHGPSSSGSRTTVSVGPTAREAAKKLRAATGGVVSKSYDGASATAKRGGDVGIRPMPITINNTQIGWGFTAAVHACEVAVDTATGHVRCLDVLCGVAAGKIYAPPQAQRQVEGGVIQGIGYALYEGVHVDPREGYSLTANLQDYRIPQLGDTPKIDIHFHEEGWPRVPGGGVGLSEVSTIGMSAAVGNAVFNATGWRPTQLPIRPDRLLEGLS
jgi:xanthine dehydrogenase YagR molybdenum-binding subunit